MNRTPNGLQQRVNNERKLIYDSGRCINLSSPECQNKGTKKELSSFRKELDFAERAGSLLTGISKP